MHVPIYIVSLARDKIRREQISQKLEELNINFQFVDAIDAKDTKNQELIDRRKNSGSGAIMSNGEIACTLSHQLVYKKIIDAQSAWNIILEDDVIIDDKFKQFYSALIYTHESQQKLNKQFLYLLGGQKDLYEYPALGVSLINYIKIGSIKFSRVNYNRQKIKRTCCYLISDTMSQKLIDLMNNHGTYIADDWALIYTNNIVKEFYLSEIIYHPVVNKFNSHIESERLEKEKDKKPRTKLNKIMKFTRSWLKVKVFALLK